TSFTFGSAFNACAAAPVPRPPHPTRPMRKVPCSSAACVGNAATPTVAIADVFRKSLREKAESFCVFMRWVQFATFDWEGQGQDPMNQRSDIAERTLRKSNEVFRQTCDRIHLILRQ